MTDLESTVSVTIDIDWAPDSAILECKELLNKYNINATFFSTHSDGTELTRDGHERALHPNFSLEKRNKKILTDIQNLHPEACGVRSHRLCTSSEIRKLFFERGLKYESNYLCYRQESLEPHWMEQHGLYQLPVYFGDFPWLRLNTRDLSVTDLLSPDGLKIFYFHPVHIVLNSPSVNYYSKNKNNYHDYKKLSQNKYDGYGVRSLFIDLLTEIEQNRHNVRTCSDIVSDL